VILRLAGIMISPVSELTTSKGIFSPSKMLLSARSVVRAIRLFSLVLVLHFLGVALGFGSQFGFGFPLFLGGDFASMTMP